MGCLQELLIVVCFLLILLVGIRASDHAPWLKIHSLERTYKVSRLRVDDFRSCCGDLFPPPPCLSVWKAAVSFIFQCLPSCSVLK